MPVVTRSTRPMKLRSPPMSEGRAPRDRSADERSPVTVTPVQDRVVINRRSASTQTYAGVRVEIDMNFLQTKYLCIPRFEGQPGSIFLQIDGRLYHNGEAEIDPNEALRLLREARCKWDAHLSKISSASMRLNACLDLFIQDDVISGGGKCPLLFAGEGTIRDVVHLHASMDASSIQGPPGVEALPVSVLGPFPNTLLGYWADVFQSRFWHQVIEGVSYHYAKARLIMEELLREGADATHFLRPLPSPPPGGRSYCRFSEPGNNILQNAKSLARAQEDSNRHFLEMYDFVEFVEEHARAQLAGGKAQGKRARRAKRKARVDDDNRSG